MFVVWSAIPAVGALAFGLWLRREVRRGGATPSAAAPPRCRAAVGSGVGRRSDDGDAGKLGAHRRRGDGGGPLPIRAAVAICTIAGGNVVPFAYAYRMHIRRAEARRRGAPSLRYASDVHIESERVPAGDRAYRRPPTGREDGPARDARLRRGAVPP